MTLNRIVEAAKVNNNILNEYCNFNKEFDLDVTANAPDATVEYKNSQKKYFGEGALKVRFQGTSEVKFTSLAGKFLSYAKETGNHFLSIGLWKSDSTADINFGIEVEINGTILPINIFNCNLYQTSGFQNGQWNVYVVPILLNANDVLNFIFKAQSDTTGADLFIDRMKLEFEDRGLGEMCQYTEVPKDVVINGVTISLPIIPANSTYKAILNFSGSPIVLSDFINLKCPKELTILGLIISNPVITFHDSALTRVEFNILNPTNAPIQPPAFGQYSIKKI